MLAHAGHTTERLDLAARVQSEEGGQVALKGFFAIMDKWGVTAEQAMILLGGMSKSTYYQYKKLPVVRLPRDMLERISYIMGIYKALRILFSTEALANDWVKRPNTALPFAGRSALAWMLQGSVRDLWEVRRYLDGQRGW